jgi:hypothetical protein
MPACPDVEAAFEFDAITDRFHECGVDCVVFPARRCDVAMSARIACGAYLRYLTLFLGGGGLRAGS